MSRIRALWTYAKLRWDVYQVRRLADRLRRENERLRSEIAARENTTR